MSKKLIILSVVGLVAVFILMYAKLAENKLNSLLHPCNKAENCCVKNEDCRYIWFTGVCNTPEYVSKVLKDAEKQGVRIGEAAPRENVTCTCEHNTCVTHN